MNKKNAEKLLSSACRELGFTLEMRGYAFSLLDMFYSSKMVVDYISIGAILYMTVQRYNFPASLRSITSTILKIYRDMSEIALKNKSRFLFFLDSLGFSISPISFDRHLKEFERLEVIKNA